MWAAVYPKPDPCVSVGMNGGIVHNIMNNINRSNYLWRCMHWVSQVLTLNFSDAFWKCHVGVVVFRCIEEILDDCTVLEK